MEDGHEQVFVPRSLIQDIMKEHQDVPLIGHVGVHQTVYQLFGGKAYGETLANTCNPVRSVSS